MENTSRHNLLEKLRPLVGARAWDYCVLWRLNEDQRYVKWMGCCCRGTKLIEDNNRAEKEYSFERCRDVTYHHPRTKSCEFLSHLPSSIPLDSGIYAETLLINQTGWFSESLEQSFMQETICTRVLIPITGGLVELFATRHVVEDHNVVDFVMRHCKMSRDETMTINMTMVPDEVESKPYGMLSSENHQRGSDCSDKINDEDDPNHKKKPSQAKNLMTEIKRREKLYNRLYALRSLVPTITKLDKASILGDAINYVKDLQKEAKELQDELEENSDTEDEFKF